MFLPLFYTVALSTPQILATSGGMLVADFFFPVLTFNFYPTALASEPLAPPNAYRLPPTTYHSVPDPES